MLFLLVPLHNLTDLNRLLSNNSIHSNTDLE